MKRKLRVLCGISLLLLIAACSLPLKMVPELEPDSGQTRILSRFSWRDLATKHQLESVGEQSLVSIKEVDHNTAIVLRRHGLLAFDVVITGKQSAVPAGGSDLVDFDLGFELSLDASPVELLMPEQVAALIESQVSPPGIGLLLVDFFAIFFTQGQSLVNGFQAQYLQSLAAAEQIRATGLYPADDSSMMRRRLYLREPELQLNAVGKLLLFVQVDDDWHRLSHCLARQASLCPQNDKVTALIDSRP